MRGAQECLTGAAGRGRGGASSRNRTGAVGGQGGAQSRAGAWSRVGARPGRGYEVGGTLQQQVEGVGVRGGHGDQF